MFVRLLDYFSPTELLVGGIVFVVVGLLWLWISRQDTTGPWW